MPFTIDIVKRKDMAQPITPAQVQMDLASMADGMTGMRRTSAPPGPNAMLGGASPAMSNQPVQQATLAEQSVRNRMLDAGSQRLADVTRQEDLMMRDTAERQQKAQDLKNETVAFILEKTSAPNTAMLFADKGMPERITRDVAVNRGIVEQMSPDLADYAGQLSA